MTVVTAQPWISRDDAAEWLADLLKNPRRLTVAQWASKAKAGDLKGWEVRHWQAIRTVDWFARGMPGEPPAFSAWLLTQVGNGGDIGRLARNFEQYSHVAVAITSPQFAALYDDLAEVMWGPDDDWREPLEAAVAELVATAQARGWRNILQQEDPAAQIPHALYRFYGDQNLLLYIGITLDPASRWKAHGKEKLWWHEVRNITVELHPSRLAAEQAEREAIRLERPRYNVTHRPGTFLTDRPWTGRVCRCETCLEYGSLPIAEREEWREHKTGDHDGLADLLTVVSQARMGVRHDWWDWRPASHCDLDRALSLLEIFKRQRSAVDDPNPQEIR